MAMQQRTLVVVCVSMLSMLSMLAVRTEATYGSTSRGTRGTSSSSSFAMEFATTGLAAEMEDLRMSMYPSTVEEDLEDQFLDEPTRRLLAARRSYISYGALNGNRSPCPARSGRSYYTPNCNSRSGPAQPYRRGCYQITRCARG